MLGGGEVVDFKHLLQGAQLRALNRMSLYVNEKTIFLCTLVAVWQFLYNWEENTGSTLLNSLENCCRISLTKMLSEASAHKSITAMHKKGLQSSLVNS